ncbi:hypothetical protein Tco_1291103, partial [Tanacetum coccineum]
LYIYDTENEVENRARALSNSSSYSAPSKSKNPINKDIIKQLVAKRGTDGRTYNLRTANEVAGLIVGDFDTCVEQRDIVIEKHREDGCPLKIPHRKKPGQPATGKKDKMSKLRYDTYSNICQSVAEGNTNLTLLGKPVLLSSSFTGGPRYMRAHNLSSTNRPDVMSRVFKMRIDQLMKDLKDLRLFGCTQAVEIPDKNEDLDLYKLVSDFMMQGPCEEDDATLVCMAVGKCTKHFPKKFTQQSSVDLAGYPVYKRRDNGRYVEKSGSQLHNGYGIPYNATLLKRPNRVSAQLYETVTNEDGQQVKKAVDEIKATPSVDRLSFHLSGEKTVLYDENSNLEIVMHKPSVGQSMFEGWMKMNEMFPKAKELKYTEFLTKYVWNAPKRIWMLRKQGRSIGRIHSVPISTGDAYYCRMLLNSAKGCRTHDEIKKVNGVVYPTYKEACYASGLLEYDKEYVDSIKDAAH